MTLLERLNASLAALDGAAPDQALLEGTALAGAAAMEAVAKLRAWVSEGSQLVNEAWDLVDRADDGALVGLLRDLVDREAGLNGALVALVRHVEDALGRRHGRSAIVDPEGFQLAAVDRQAASTKWNVEDAWPAIARAVRAAERLPIGDPVDGEVEDDTARALRIIRQLCGVGYLRVEACGALGIDPDEYRTKGGYRWVVKLP